MTVEEPFRRMVVARVDGRLVVLSFHAVKRWCERVEPRLAIREAAAKLVTAVAERGSISSRRPNGVEASSRAAQMLETVAWLSLDGAAFPLVDYGDDELVAKTCIPQRRTR